MDVLHRYGKTSRRTTLPVVFILLTGNRKIVKQQNVFFSFWTRKALRFHTQRTFYFLKQKTVRRTLQKMKNHKRIRSTGDALYFTKWKADVALLIYCCRCTEQSVAEVCWRASSGLAKRWKSCSRLSALFSLPAHFHQREIQDRSVSSPFCARASSSKGCEVRLSWFFNPSL